LKKEGFFIFLDNISILTPYRYIGGIFVFYIKQLTKCDCGVTSLKVLLANLLKNKEYLYLPFDERKKNFSYLELIKIAESHGVKLIGIKCSENKDISTFNNYPSIITIYNSENSKHAIVLLKKKKDKILIFDPSLGKRLIKITELNEIWDGTGLIVEEIIKSDHKFSVFNKIIDARDLIILYGLEVISSLSILISIYFLNGSYNGLFYASLFLILYVLFSVLFRLFLSKTFTKTRKNLLSKLSVLPKDPHEFIKRYEDFKVNYFLPKISLINSILTILIISFILLYNGIINIYIIFSVLLTALLERFVFKKTLSKLANKILFKEEKQNFSSVKAFKNELSEIENQADKYSNLTYLFQIISNGIILFSSFIITLNKGVLSTVSLLFYFVFARHIYLEITSLLSFKEKIEKLDESKAKLSKFIN
jgi:predicted double-glycine peptidase